MEPTYAASECQDCGNIPADTYEHPSGDGTEYTFCPECYARNLDEYYEALAIDEAERGIRSTHLASNTP